MISLNNSNRRQPITDNDSLDGDAGSTDGDRRVPNLSLFTIDCPICLEKRRDYVTLMCGHKICNHCEKMLIQHNKYDVCPECRTPIYPDVENSHYLNLTDETPREMLESITEFDNVRYDGQIITDFQQLIDETSGEAVVQITVTDENGRIKIINRRLVDHIDVIEPERRINRITRVRHNCYKRCINCIIVILVLCFFVFIMFGSVITT